MKILLTAIFTFLFIFQGSAQKSAMAQDQENIINDHGAIIRFDTTKKNIYLVFTAHEFGDGAETILSVLKKQQIHASFFFTGDFYRNKKFSQAIQQLVKDGQYLGGHSDKHLLYAPWEKRDSTLISREEFEKDLHANYNAMEKFGITKNNARYFLPPYEWHNDTIAQWINENGLQLVNFTPGTSSNADYTTPDLRNYLSSDSILQRILRYEKRSASGLNGFLLLTHFGVDEKRTDKFYLKLDELIDALKQRGYSFKRL